MKNFDSVIVISHIAFRKTSPICPIEGPYSSILSSLTSTIKKTEILGLPIDGYENEIIFGNWKRTREFNIPSILGKLPPLKFLLDIIFTTVHILNWSMANKGKKKLVIGIDPLSCLPLVIFKKMLGYTLVFHCVDFNKKRFENKLMQYFYELADKWATRYSDETWVICEELKNYKQKHFGVNSHYIPNSVIFNPNLFKNGSPHRNGNKMIWTGSLLTDKQFDILFGFLSMIQKQIRKDLEFILAPTKDHDKFESYSNKYRLKNIQILRLNGRSAFQEIASKCDVGIALYDEAFGSTQFIEPMKIWDFLLCGLPFIVSKEPSISTRILNSGVVYRLNSKNQLPDLKSLKNFLTKNNLEKQSSECLKIAKEYDIDVQIKKRLKVLLLSV